MIGAFAWSLNPLLAAYMFYSASVLSPLSCSVSLSWLITLLFHHTHNFCVPFPALVPSPLASYCYDLYLRARRAFSGTMTRLRLVASFRAQLLGAQADRSIFDWISSGLVQRSAPPSTVITRNSPAPDPDLTRLRQQLGGVRRCILAHPPEWGGFSPRRLYFTLLTL